MIRADITLSALLLTSSLGAAENPVQAFALANEAYRNAYTAAEPGKRREALEEAVNGYRSVLASRQNGLVWYNLGNALFRLGRKGEAIHAYRRARILLGKHPDLTANLEYVRSLVRDAPSLPEPHPVLRVLFFWYYAASMRGLEYVFAATFLAFIASLTVAMWSGKKRWTLLTAGLGLLLVAAGTATALRYREWTGPNVAVVLKDGTQALSESQPLATPLFRLGEGAEVCTGRKRAGWTEVILPDGRHGWASDEAFEPVLQESVPPTVEVETTQDSGDVPGNNP